MRVEGFALVHGSCQVSGDGQSVSACVELAVDGVFAAKAALRPAYGGPTFFPTPRRL